MKEAGRSDIPTQPSTESPKPQPSVLSPIPPPAGDMVPLLSEGEWVDAPTTPLPQGRRPTKGPNTKRTGGKRVIKVSHRRMPSLVKRKAKKASGKKPRRKR
jgi:hypothetical protein